MGEGTDPVGLQLVLAEDLMHGVPTDPSGLSQAAHAPLGRVRWALVAGCFHHPEAVGLRVHPGPARTGLIGQPVKPVEDEPLSPPGDHRPGQVHFLGNLRVRGPLCSQEDQPRPLDLTVGGTPEFFSLVLLLSWLFLFSSSCDHDTLLHYNLQDTILQS